MAKQVKLGDISQDDIIIALMGPTGTGKSTFINVATEQGEETVGHRLKSHTSEIQAVKFLHPRSRRPVVFVDTPGFDDTYKSDTEILRMISTWLEKTYKKKITLAGIIYLHRISDNRMAGTPLKNLRMFANLCGSDAIGAVILATTMWELVESNEGTKRLEQLEAKYWKGMLEKGSTIARFEKTSESAWEIVDIIIARRRSEDPSLLIQREIVDDRRLLGETQAGITLYNALQRLLADQREEVRKLRDDAKLQNNPQLVRVLNAQYLEIEENLRRTFDQMQEIKVPLGRRILSFLKFKKGHALTIAIPN